MGYKEDVIIDHADLDVECLRQAEKMLTYTEIAADKKRELDVAEEELSFIQSTLDKKIRKDPAKYKLEKVTVDAVAATIANQDKYREAVKHVINCRYEKNTADGMVKSFEQRKSMLEALVKLHGQSYFAGPSIPRDLSSKIEAQDKRVNKRVLSKKKPKTKKG